MLLYNLTHHFIPNQNQSISQIKSLIPKFDSNFSLREIPASISMLAPLTDSVAFRFFTTLFIEEEISPMSNSGFSSTASCRKIYEEAVDDADDDDGYCEFFDADDGESPEPSFVFKFEYQTREILKTLEKYDEVCHYVALQSQKSSTSCFVEEAQNGSAQESNCDSVEAVGVDEEKNAIKGFIIDDGALEKSDSDEVNCGSIEGFRDGAFEEEEVEKRIVIEQVEADINDEVDFSSSVNEVSDVNEEVSHSDEKSEGSGDETMTTSHEDELVSEEDFVSPEISSGSICSSHDDDDDDDELDALEEVGFHKSDGFDDEDDDIMEQYRELEASCRAEEQNLKRSELKGEEKLVDDCNGFDDSDTMEALWEHQELIDQLKMEHKRARAVMEHKRARATALPTIPEESEYLDMNDLRLLMFDEKYRSYRTQMRKLDKSILFNHKLIALGVLKSKGQLKSFSSYKFSTPVKSFLSNLRLCRTKQDCDPIVKLIKDVHSELEVVYVGHLCLSWEFLQWQYEKTLELLESAPSRIHSYNAVAEELQQFRVLLQRFVEDELFQGPRVETYVKIRSAMHKLLQVPLIREDKPGEGKTGNEITTDDIIDMLRESIMTMWRFIRADKNASIFNACRKRSLDGACLDSKLLREVQAHLREKVRMLKELKRRQNRNLKRFLKHEEREEVEDNRDHGHMNFFSEVNITLVSRVLNMSTLTNDRLVWCQSKLSQIQFV